MIREVVEGNAWSLSENPRAMGESIVGNMEHEDHCEMSKIIFIEDILEKAAPKKGRKA